MYSQSGELEPILEEIFGNRQGFYLEVGCWDGRNMSNSLHLELKGWRGLCVDPFPKNFEHRKCMLYVGAISADGLDREFVWVKTDKRTGGDVSYLSGFRSSLTVHWDFIVENCNYTITYVDTITVEQLYRKYKLPKYIEFLSVDVEGAEIEVFSGWNLDVYRFGMISFEHNGNENVKRYIGELLSRRGYRFHRSISIHGYPTDDIYISGGIV